MIQKYDSYKSSGIEWLGDIPSHWEAEKVKFIFEENSIKNHGKEIMLAATQNKGVIPKDELENKSVEAIVTDLNSFKLVQKGNFVISLRSFEGGIEYSKYQGIISPAYTVLKSKIDIEDGFFKYLFKSFKFIEALNVHKTGIREGQNISFKKFKDDYLTLPPKEEQEAIADFLDKKCKNVDNYILKQKELIELLKEKKSSLINKVVTKGLDSKVEYKDSGIEWHGDIPNHWEVKKLKTFCDYVNRGIPPKYIEKSDYKVVNQATISKGFLNETSIKYHKFSNSTDNRGILKKNDILIASTGGGVLGKVYLFNTDGKYIADSHITVLRDSKNRFICDYIYFWLSINFDLINGVLSQGSTNQIELQKNWLKSMFFCLPPKQEQKQIVEYIEKERAKIDKAISHIEDEIKLLQEYKQSLISSAVTGKIKVV